MFYDVLKNEFENSVFRMHSFDNVTVTVIPEPGSYNLFADETGMMLAKALLYKRLKADDHFTLFSASKSTVFEDCMHRTTENPKSRILYVYSETEFNAEEETELVESGFVRLTPIEEFLKSKGVETKLYVNDKYGTAILWTKEDALPHLHLAMSFFPRYFPAYFRENPLQKDERDLCMTLTETEPKKFVDAIKAYNRRPEFKEMQLRETIVDMVKGTWERRVEARKENLDEKQERLRRIEEQFQDALRNLREANRMYEEAMNLKPEETDEDLVQYLLRNKSIDVVGHSNEMIQFYVRTKLDTFNEDFWEGLSAKGRIYTGYSLNAGNTFANAENAKLLLDAIFLTKELELKLVSYIDLDLSGYVTSDRDHTYPPEYKDYIPNPHLQIHNCFGQSRAYITEAITSGDLITAFDQCVMTASSVDLGETPQTLRPMIEWIFKSKAKILMTKDGQSVTPVMALAMLKKEHAVADDTKEE